MKKILIVIALLIPQVSFGFTVGWNATSTLTPWVSPDKVNGVLQTITGTAANIWNLVTANRFTATSTSQASIFPYASTTALSATSLCLTADCRTSWPTGTVTGTGADNRVAIWSGASSLDSGTDFTWDSTADTLTVIASLDSGTTRLVDIGIDGGGVKVFEIVQDGTVLISSNNATPLVGISTSSPSAKLSIKGAGIGVGQERLFAVSNSSNAERYLLTSTEGMTAKSSGTWIGQFINDTVGAGKGGINVQIADGANTVSALKLTSNAGAVTILDCHTTPDIDVPECDTNATLDMNSESIKNVNDITAQGGAFTDLTTTGVVFAGTSDVLTTDGTNFVWDDANNRLGIGTPTPGFPLDIVQLGGDDAGINITGVADGGTLTQGYLRGISGLSGDTMWILGDDSSGAYGLMGFGGRSSLGRVAEVDFFDNDLTGDKRTGTILNHRLNAVGVTSGAYYMQFVPTYDTVTGGSSVRDFTDNAFTISSAGSGDLAEIGIGVAPASITALLHLTSGSTAAGRAPLKFTSGSLLTTAEAGTLEYLTNRFYIRGSDGLSVSGNVGIGTTTPHEKLTVNGNAYIAGNITATSTATSTFFGSLAITEVATSSFAGGIDLTSGCFAINNVCIGGSNYGDSNVNAYIHASTTIPKTYTNNAFTNTGTTTFTSSIAIGTSTSNSLLEINGGFHTEEQSPATSTSMSIDFCSRDTSNRLRLGVGTANIAVTFTNYSACPGKSIVLRVWNPATGLIGSTTFTGTNFYWDGYVNPGSNTTNGGMDEFVFDSTNGTTTPFIWAKLNSTLP